MTTAKTPATMASNDGIVASQIKRFVDALAATEKRYAELLAFNAGMKKKGMKFRSEAIRAKFQKNLDDGRAAVTKGRDVRAMLVKALKFVGANPKDYGLGLPIIPLAVGGAIVYAVVTATNLLVDYVKGNGVPSVDEITGPDATPEAKAAALQIRADALNAEAEAKKNTLDRVLDNLPLIGGLGLGALFLPKLLAMLPARKAAA